MGPAIKDAPNIRALLRPANGSSQPWFCTLDDNSEWLVKFAGAGPGPSALVAEHVANSLGRLWGLPIPRSMPVRLGRGIKRAGTDEFWDVLANSEGWNLAIELIAEASNKAPDATLPRGTQESMLAFDTVVQNWDRTALSRNLLEDAVEGLWWIDHGSCRFLHLLSSETVRPVPANHALATEVQTLDAHPFTVPPKEHLEAIVASIPDAWLTSIGAERSALATAIAQYLGRATY